MILGVLIVGAVAHELTTYWRERGKSELTETPQEKQGQGLTFALIRRLMPYIGRSALVGTVIGALPGIGSTLAATIGCTIGRARPAKTKSRKNRTLDRVHPRALPRLKRPIPRSQAPI